MALTLFVRWSILMYHCGTVNVRGIENPGSCNLFTPVLMPTVLLYNVNGVTNCGYQSNKAEALAVS